MMVWPNLQPLVDSAAFYIKVQAVSSLVGNGAMAMGAACAAYMVYRFIRLITTAGKGGKS